MGNKRIALITGATSGIGAAFAQRMSDMGYDLIITGRRKEKIQALADKLKNKYNNRVEVIIAELSKAEDVDKIVKRIESEENIEFLINNAGFGTDKSFFDENIKTHKIMSDVHVLTPLKFIYAVVPQMRKLGNGAIINVSSIAAFTPAPGNGMYCATKSFLNLFSESIYLELIGSGIKVQALCPGFTRTDFHEKMGMDNSSLKNKGIVRWMATDKVVEISIKQLKKNKVICIPGFWNKFIIMLLKIIPRRLYYFLAKNSK